jgi:hypothetical protein
VSIQTVWQTRFSFLPGKSVVVWSSEASMSSDGGLLPIREFDERFGRAAQFAAALWDPRPVGMMIGHRFLVHGFLADNEDQNDHDTLRSDPVFKLHRRPLAQRRRLGQPADAVAVREQHRDEIAVEPA